MHRRKNLDVTQGIETKALGNAIRHHGCQRFNRTACVATFNEECLAVCTFIKLGVFAFIDLMGNAHDARVLLLSKDSA